MGLLETFRILRTVPDADVRRYLEIALVEPYEELQSMAFELLFEQENYDSPDVIVRNYTALLPSLRRRILERKRDFLPVAREQTRRGSEKARENAYRLIEEIGETGRAILKSDEPEIKDGLGDAFVVLVNLAHLCGHRLEDCIEESLQVIESRTGKMVDGVFVKDE